VLLAAEATRGSPVLLTNYKASEQPKSLGA
jgi:hypothetical protein